MTLADWFPKHLAIVSIKATEGTVDDYRKIAERSFLPGLGHKPLDMITRQDVIDFIAWYMKQPNQASVAAREKAEREGRPLPPLKPLKVHQEHPHGVIVGVAVSDGCGTYSTQPGQGCAAAPG